MVQVKDKWNFQMTARYEMYRDLLTKYCEHDFEPQIVRDPSMGWRSGEPVKISGVAHR